MRSELEFDVASALFQGRRETQEDAIATDFTIGAGHGIVVLADGMGGHQAGDVASQIVVTEVYSELKLWSASAPEAQSDISKALRNAAKGANECLRRQAEVEPANDGMGSTLVALVQRRDALYWVSVGDSLLCLFRAGNLRRLNQDHSLAPQIDLMVKRGVLSEELGKGHPQRSCLTSALTGGRIAKMDCPDTPLTLFPGDIVIAASDGLQSLSEHRLRSILGESRERPSGVIARTLLDAITEFDDPQQDNVCLSVIKVCAPHGADSADHDRATASEAPAREGPKCEEPTLHFAAVRGDASILNMLRRITGNLL